MAKETVKQTALEVQQQAQIQELDLIVKALESSNNLVNFRLGVVVKQNQELQAKVNSLEEELAQPAPKEKSKKEIN